VNALAQLQEWYVAQCNGDWEHTYGVSIGTLDNPGWTLEVELTGTALEAQRFDPVAHGVVADTLDDEQDWLSCEVKGAKFIAAGGPRKLDDMILVFLHWARSRPPNTSFERTREG
jgi:Immunity protein 53